ncbi:MAG: hypothetical protein CMP40_02795 [Rickettsiales bacterium]|nr:hypothetical protein [Rickettsiales bacterium]
MRRLIILLLTFILISLSLGFIFFFNKIHYKDTHLNNNIKGIAVLTGGKGRIKLGLQALGKYPHAKLIISGVDKKVSDEFIIPSYIEDKKKIYIDRLSESTIQNAKVISSWAKENNINNILVITSYYHIPRSILLLESYSPNINFYPFPVKRKSIKELHFIKKLNIYLFLTEEYIKYLLSHLTFVIN